jgi:sensor histidine kinase YesM
MENLDQENFPTGRMWRLYAAGWTALMLLVAFATQIDDLHKGKFNQSVLIDLALNTLLAGTLALLWPLMGWMERRQLSSRSTTWIHVGLVAVLSAASLAVAIVRLGPDKPTLWYVGSVLNVAINYVLVATIFNVVRVNHARRRQAVAIERAHALLVASELNALRSKLNPHFLFNTLHSIIALTRRDPAAAETALFQFSDMLRYVLDTEKNGSARVTLDDEVTFVRDYLELEALRLGTRLQIDWRLDDDAGQRAMPALSLQPLVENSIKHAFNPHSRPGRLTIRSGIDPRSQALTVTVADDGPGAEALAVRTTRGLGIRTVERRLQLEYGEQYGLDIATAPGAGFAVTMTIPFVAA